MWSCKKCEYKNSNSSLNCHGKDCDGVKEKDGILPLREIPKKEKKVKKLYDYCPACQRDMFFTGTRWRGKKAWSCESGSHRPYNFTGRSKPYPIQEAIQ